MAGVRMVAMAKVRVVTMINNTTVRNAYCVMIMMALNDRYARE